MNLMARLGEIVLQRVLGINRRDQEKIWRSYPSYEDAMMNSTGYDSDLILNKTRNALLKVKNGEAAYERDSVLFGRIQYAWPLLAGLMWVAARNNGRLNLIDFGGSLGSTYFQNRIFLESLPEVRWNIVEQKRFVDCGKQYFEDGTLRFYYDIKSCLKEQAAKVILFSGVVQYLEDPYGMIREVCDHGMEYILFDRTSFSATGEDVITVQKTPPSVYEASYPCWFLGLNQFKRSFEKQYELIAEFDSSDKVDFPSFFRGFIFRRRQGDNA